MEEEEEEDPNRKPRKRDMERILRLKKVFFVLSRLSNRFLVEDLSMCKFRHKQFSA